MRLLTGHTTEALAGTVALFLAGLAVGSAAAAFSLRRGIPLRGAVARYAACEGGAALSGVAVLAVLSWMGKGVGASALFHGAGLWVFVAALLAVPTVLLGAALPLLLAACSHPHGEPAAGRVPGKDPAHRGPEPDAPRVPRTSQVVPTSFVRLYGWNTAGAAVGALIGGWFVLPALGHSGLVGAAALCNGMAVLVVLLAPSQSAQRPARNSTEVEFLTPVLPSGSRVSTAVLIIAGGWCTVALQLLWLRLAQLALGPSVWVFPAVLCALLAGMALAAFHMAAHAAGGTGGTAATTASRLLPLAMATAVIGGAALWGNLPPLVLKLHHWSGGEAPFPMLQALLLLASFTAGFPVAYALGRVFPLLALKLAPDPRQAGWPLALSILGSVLAAPTAPLCLRAFGVSGTAVVLATVAFALAAGAARGPQRNSVFHDFRGVGLTALSAGLAAFTAFLLLPLNPALLTSGAFHNRIPAQALIDDGYTDVTAYLTQRLPVLTAWADDGSALISAHRAEDGRRFFRINGKVDGGTGGDRTTNELVAVLPFLVRNPSAPLANVLTIGLGTGATHQAVLFQPEVQRAAVVEISPVVARFAAEYFPEYAVPPRTKLSGVAKQPGAAPATPSLIIADGRAYLRAQSPGSLDLVVSEPSNPWVEGEAGLFSEEYFRLVASRLKTTGLASLWFHSYGMSCEAALPVLAALSHVFPRILLFHVAGDYFAVASPAVGAPLSYHGADAAAFLTESLWHDETSLAALTVGVAPHRDLHPRIAYDAGATFHTRVQCKRVEQRRLADPLSRMAGRKAWDQRFGGE